MNNVPPTVSLSSRLARINLYVLVSTIVLVTVFILFTWSWVTIEAHLAEGNLRLSHLEVNTAGQVVIADRQAAAHDFTILRTMPYLRSVTIFRKDLSPYETFGGEGHADARADLLDQAVAGYRLS